MRQCLMGGLAICGIAMSAGAQAALESKNAEVIARVIHPGTQSASGGIWGYTGPDKKEYVLHTIQNPGALAVYEVFDGQKPVVPPVERGYIPAGHNSLWQEVTGCGGFAYRVSQDGQMGMQIIDLRPVNSGQKAKEVKKMTADFSVAHQIYCDESVTPNRLFVAYGGTAGTKIYTLEDHANPKLVATIAGETHDMFGKGNRLFTFKGRSKSINIYDITTPSSPKSLGSFTPPKTGYMHQGWLSEDNKYLFIATETAAIPLYVYDVSDPANPKKVGEFPTSNYGVNIIHNVYVLGKELYLGHYQSGMRVLDISDPATPKEFAVHRVNPSRSGWNGCWGVYPYFKSGLVAYGEMQYGFYVVRVSGGPNNQGTSLNARLARGAWGIDGSRDGLVSFRLPGAGAYRLSLLTPDGRQVLSRDGQGDAGMQTLSLNRDLASGKYIARLSQNASVWNSPLVLNP